MQYIQRPDYMDWLHRWRDKDAIKIVSGVRRCGKSTLLEMFRRELVDSGIAPERTIALNFEDIANEHLADYHALYEFISERLVPGETTYVFLDEIQHVEHFEKALDSLCIKDNCDLYVTGSNAYLLSSELATLLTGRYVELKMLPLSFSEFFESSLEDVMATPSNLRNEVAHTGSATDAIFMKYLQMGSFPYVTNLLSEPKTAREYVQDVYTSILFKDVMQRMRISDASLLERVAKVLASSVGSLVSTNKITNTLQSNGRSVDQKTIDKYIDALNDSMLFYEARRWDVKGRKLLSRLSKYYVVDTGLRSNLVESSSSDLGHLLENVVYLELLRRFDNVYVGILSAGEIDFVATSEGKVTYFQVAASVLDADVLERELAPFEKVNDGAGKVLLTLDRILPEQPRSDVWITNVVDWLLRAPEPNPDSLASIQEADDILKSGGTGRSFDSGRDLLDDARK